MKTTMLDKWDRQLLSYSMVPKHRRKAMRIKDLNRIIQQELFEPKYEEAVRELLGSSKNYKEYREFHSKKRLDNLTSLFWLMCLVMLTMMALL